jgi:hypothetical protein
MLKGIIQDLSLATSGQNKVLNMIKNFSATDIARTISQNFGDQSHGVCTTFPQLQIKIAPTYILVVTRSLAWCD